ncbi:MAG: chemotaxis protein [Marinicaulis sp.]|nr:rod-binding protein [Marinicaulis sp.]NNE42508.1 chemotaxis protein [Marinicaulis sp.]NNL87544.1 chemotaxis protein [Marinicaulis sp.]
MEINALTSTQQTLAPEQRAAIDRRAEEFEALFLSQLLKPMFDSAKAPSLFGGDGPEQDAYGAMLHEEYGKAIAARGGVGIADHVRASLIQLQSAKSD